MKKGICFLMICFLLLSWLQVVQAQSGLGQIFEGGKQTETGGLGQIFEGSKPVETGGLGAIFERSVPTLQPELAPTPTPMIHSDPVVFPEPASALFDEGIRDITCDAYGNRVDYAQIGNWIIRRGYLMDIERYCLIGQVPGNEVFALTDALPMSFVPAGDVIVYYGADENGNYNWVVRDPDEAGPKRLDLGISDEVFYADEDFIWYYTHIGEETSIRKLTRKGGERVGVARTKGIVVTKMDSGGILMVDFDKNELKLAKDGSKVLETTTIYKPEEPIISVSSAGKSIWVEHEHEFGLLENGTLPFRLPGHIVSMTGTTDQYVMLLSFPGSDTYDVVIFNDIYRAYARVGYVIASEDAFVELQPDEQMTVWGPEESLIFGIPPADEWIPYGYYDVASAQEAIGASLPVGTAKSDPLPTYDPMQEDVVTITIPANLSSLTEESVAMADAEAAGISMVVNRDGSYTYFMTPQQHQEQLQSRGKQIRDTLDMVISTAPYNKAIKAYTTNDDFSEIILTVVADQMEDALGGFVVTILGMVAPTYQALEGKKDTPVTVIKVIDDATGKTIATYNSADDFIK